MFIEVRSRQQLQVWSNESSKNWFEFFISALLSLVLHFSHILVGGSETQINEYPSMAGIVDSKERRVYCGATISKFFI